MFTRICALETCGLEFQTDNPRKMHHSKQCAQVHKMRRFRSKRKTGGGGGGGNGGGGGEPTLFDTITPVDSRATYVPDTCYRTPADRKPVEPVTTKNLRRKAAA